MERRLKMSKDIELKDNLYYADLIYAVKKLGAIEHIEDSEAEERISLRLQPVYDENQEKENELIGEELSDFELDLFLVIRVIGKKAGHSFRSIADIRKYPEVIQEVLLELENKNMENKNTFGKNLRALREGAGIGQVKLALDLGVSKGIISLWENEKREPTMSYLIALAKYFDVSIDYLVGLE